MTVFRYNTYKDFLRAYIDANPQKGVISQVASLCGCDRTYLSQVLNGKAELTPDHLVQFSDSIGLSEEEAQYLMMVLLRDRSGSATSRKSLDTKIEKLKSKALAVSQIVKREKTKEISEAQRTQYYSTWQYGAIHILTSIPALQTAQAISDKMQLPQNTTIRLLKDLIEMGAVRKEKDRYIHAGGDVYLTRDNPQLHAHHLSWRMKAVERTMFPDEIHYTNIYSISQKDVEKIRHQILQLIEEQRKIVRDSGTDVAGVFCLDFFTL